MLDIIQSRDTYKTPSNGYQNKAGLFDITSDDYNRSAIEQELKDSSYYQQFLNNPYMSFYYKDSLLDNLASSFGFQSGFDKTKAEWIQNAKEYDAKLLDALRQENYNDPVSQVARDRAAGLNVDLNGGQKIDNASAPELANPQLDANAMYESPAIQQGIQTVSSIGQMASMFFSGALSLVKNFQEIGLNSTRLVADEIKNNNDAFDFVVKTIVGATRDSDLKFDDDDVLVQLIDASESVADQSFKMYRPKTAKLMKRYYNMLRDDVKSGNHSLFVEKFRSELQSYIASNRKSTGSIMASPFYADNVKDIAELSREFVSAQVKAEQAMWIAKQRESEYKQGRFDEDLGKKEKAAAYNEASYSAAHFDSELGSSQNQAEKAIFGAQYNVNKQTEIIEGMFTNVYKKLSEMKSPLATAGLIMLPLLRAFASSAVSAGGTIVGNLVK